MNRSYFLLSALAVMIFLAGCSTKATSSAEFWVRGNCDMCKDTIEKALNELEGVAEATYNVDANMATISYDSTKVTEMDLHKACANAGYETKLLEANLEAYGELSKCCKKPEDM